MGYGAGDRMAASKFGGFTLFHFPGCTLCATMFCPECHAEYRPGFTHCTDCEVDLVDTLGESAYQGHAEVAPQTAELNVLLWKGADTDFYLSLLGALDGFGIGSLGRAVNAS